MLRMTCSRALGCLVILLGLVPAATAAQALGTVTDRSKLVSVSAEWAGLIYARAAAAVYAGDMRAIDAALTDVARLPGGSVDAHLEPRSVPVDPQLSPAGREAFIRDVVLPYLHPVAVGQSVSCGATETLEMNSFDDSGVSSSLQQVRLSCPAGPVPFAYFGTRQQVRGESDITVEGFQIGNTPVLVSILSDGGMEIAPQTESGTLLAMAASRGHAAAVERLLRGGAAPDALSASGRTALMDAVATEHLATVRALVAGGANVDLTAPGGRTALFMAARAGRPQAVDALIAGGAQVTAVDRGGWTPLHVAVDSGGAASDEVLERLVEAGAQIERPTTATRSRPLHVALANGHSEAAVTLLRLGADASAPDGSGANPITLAIQARLDVLEELVAAGADLDEPDGDGRTAIHHAVTTANLGMLQQVLAMGGGADTPDASGSTALMLAAETGQSDAVAVLLNAGADLRATDSRGNTPLHRAANAGLDRTAEALLRAGAPRGAKNADGRSPQSLAGANGHGNVQSVFRHTKFLHLALLKGSFGFTRLADPQHEASVGYDFAIGLGVKVHERLRIQTEVAWATRSSDPMEEGPIIIPGNGDFYYNTYSMDIRPSARLALGNPYRTHVYLVGGVSFSTIEEVEILDWSDTEADGLIVTNQSDLKMTSPLAGLGVQGTLGRTITSVELVVARGSEVRLDRFMGSMGTVMFGLSFAW